MPCPDSYLTDLNFSLKRRLQVLYVKFPPPWSLTYWVRKLPHTVAGMTQFNENFLSALKVSEKTISPAHSGTNNHLLAMGTQTVTLLCHFTRALISKALQTGPSNTRN